MCGLVGLVFREPIWKSDKLNDLINKMSDRIFHRGPDSGGSWVDAKEGIAFGHRRLSIIDLSEAGHQPMLSPSQRYQIVLNGEIYNFNEIRKEICESPGCADRIFRGHSDTEIFLHAIELWGVEKSLQKTVGMFAFALWDSQEKKLYLARDRMGEKPLYYGFIRDAFFFGSDLVSLKSFCPGDLEIDRDALCLLLRHNYIPAPHSIFVGIKKMVPGHFIEIPISSIRNGDLASHPPRPFWNIWEKELNCLSNQFCEMQEDEVIGELEKLIKQSVSQQMISDVPLGAFLSGGIDSSLVVAIMQSLSSRPVKTFTIGFNDKAFNEAVYAKEIASFLGTEHTEQYVNPKDALDIVPEIHGIFSEPFADSSQIPTILVSRLAKKHVTVSLSGDAGDELFGGYSRYTRIERLFKLVSLLGLSHDSIFSNLGKFALNGVFKICENFPLSFLGNHNSKKIKRKLENYARVLGVKDFEDFYRILVSHWKKPTDVILNSKEPPTIFSKEELRLIKKPFEKMMLIDKLSYLPDDILVKVDRAAMSVGLESRVPFLDWRIVEFSARIPTNLKRKNNQGKYPLRKILAKYVPERLFNRPKMGFGVPLNAWMVGPLKDWVTDLLSKDRIIKQGFFEPIHILTRLDETLNGKVDWSPYLWDVIAFQSWQEHWKKN